MLSALTFQYPAWFLIFCVLLGVGYAALLYYKTENFKEQAPGLHKWLAALRALSVALISMLLLAPLLKNRITETKQPIVVLAQDASESMQAAFTPEQLASYKAEIGQLRQKLAEKYEVRTVAFGDALRDSLDFGFSDKTSNLSEALAYINDQYSTLNLGAVILATDGIYNEGTNPLYANQQNTTAPIYTVALGDTTAKRDLLIKRALHNKIVFLNDKTTIQADIGAYNLAGNTTTLSLSRVEGDQVIPVNNLPISIGGGAFFTTKEFVVEATKPGLVQYRLSASKLNGEASTNNNVRDIFIEVLDARQKILLYANAPHPDLTAFRQTIEANKNYVVTLHNYADGPIDVTKFDFVLFHNLPSAQADISGAMSLLNSNRIPRMFVAGAQTNFVNLNAAQQLVSAQSDGRQTDDVNGRVSKSFAAFTLSPQLSEELANYAPIKAPFGTFTASPQAQVVLHKRIGKVDTQQPLLALGETNGIKTGVLLAEGVWKWRLFNFMQQQNYQLFDELIGKTIQYLSLKEDKRRFRVQLEKNIFDENEPIQFNAELYNDSYELVNEPDISLSIKNKEGKEFPYTFTRQGKGYVLNAGVMPVGGYTYQASVQFNGQKLTSEGRFTVRAIELELFETTANHGLLREISAKTGGITFNTTQLTALADSILAKPTIKPILYETTTTDPLIHLKWIFALLAFLLGLEWFLRRYYGAY
jgi:hypothetical protein